jgi:penicillin-binding protein 1A
MRKSFVHLLWGLLTVFVLSTAFAFTAIYNGWIGYMPPVEELQNPINRFASQVYSADGKLMGTWNYSRENRIMVDYSNISPYLVKALVATEDVRFYRHSGIDFYALGRAVVKRGLLGQRSAGGGSTITQQLAKQLFSETANSTLERLLQKPIEWVIAVKLERNYTKEEIITMYLNYFDFLHNAVGIKTAANTYFGKEPKNLTVTESATLVGMVKNPSFYNPIRYPERCTERRNIVLQQMAKAGYITTSDYDKYVEEPLSVNYHRIDHKDGIAVYFRDYLRRRMMAKQPSIDDYPSWNKSKYVEDSIAWATDPLYGWCNKNTKKNGEHYNVYTDGLKIYTTIDSRMQRYAEEALLKQVAQFLQPAFDKEKRGRRTAPYSSNLTADQVQNILNRSIEQSERYKALKAGGANEDEIKKSFRTPIEMTVFSYHGDIDTTMSPIDSIKYYKSFLRAGFMSMNPMNGQVKAYVGGLDFDHFQYDMCMEGRRQVGSTIKPFLYALAMENGYTPCDEAPNRQQTYMVAGNPWTPRNASHARYGQMVTLKWGLANSNNWISAYLMSRLNPTSFVSLLREFGIMNQNIHPSMALCLGPCDISVAEMVSAYSTFANHGIRCAPMLVTKIVDSEGETVAQFQPRMNEVISEESAYKMLELLKAVIDQGTGHRMRYKFNVDCEMGGKTGTTNNNSDGWFIGFTPTLVSGCWIGGEDRDIHFDNMSMGQGATMALPVWAYYMQRVFADQQLGYNPDAIFDTPANYNPCYTEATEAEENGIDEIYE